MDHLDILILTTAGYGLYKGFRKGFIHMVLSLAGLVLALYLAVKFSGLFIPFLAEKLHTGPEKMRWLAYLLVFTGTLITVSLLSRLLNKLIKSVGLGWLNKTAGALLSALKNLLIIGLFFKLVASVQERFALFPDDYTQSSQLYQPLMRITDKTISLADDWTRNLKNKKHTVEQEEGEKDNNKNKRTDEQEK